ncbi:MAG: HepT-like ribonuclease domain-containing protein [bacterium]
MDNKIKTLKRYFKGKDEVLLAFIFGSRAKKTQNVSSDWDIAVYFNPYQNAEIETKNDYPLENKIWAEIERVLCSDNVDLLILNRAKPSLVFSILNSGIPLVIKNRNLYLKLLIKTHYEAVDFWNFTKEFFEIGERAKSLSEEDKSLLREHIRFLENEFEDLEELTKLTQNEYIQDRNKRRNIERWVENLVMSAIDISKIILASEKSNIPQTYKEVLLWLGLKFMDEEIANRFSEFAYLRNIVVHEYLDIKWERIRGFIKDARQILPVFIDEVKNRWLLGE